MDEGEINVPENEAENFKMVERTTTFTISLFGTALQKLVLKQHEPRDQFWKNRRLKILD
jgi:hypothetical protein